MNRVNFGIIILIMLFFIPKDILAADCTTEINECCTINLPGSYRLVQNLYANGDCIVIDHVNNRATILDCNGYSITGSNKQGNGIKISDKIEGTFILVKNCKIKNFQIGIYADPNGRAEIDYNTVFNNKYGIYLSNFQLGSTVYSNVVTDNDYGIAISASNNNLIYNNYFKNSVKNALVGGGVPINTWDIVKTPGPNIIGGPWKGGNYWSDYTGIDTDRDGLGNTPYTIDTNNIDNSPLVDKISPRDLDWSLTIYSNIYTFNITWSDNVRVDQGILELDNVNYTAIKAYENEELTPSKIEHKVTYSRSFSSLPTGQHYFKWYANDTRNNWNSTHEISFNAVPTTTSTTTSIPQCNSTDPPWCSQGYPCGNSSIIAGSTTCPTGGCADECYGSHTVGECFCINATSCGRTIIDCRAELGPNGVCVAGACMTTTSIITTTINCLPIHSGCTIGGTRCCQGSCIRGFCITGGGGGGRNRMLDLIDPTNSLTILLTVIIIMLIILLSVCLSVKLIKRK